MESTRRAVLLFTRANSEVAVVYDLGQGRRPRQEKVACHEHDRPARYEYQASENRRVARISQGNECRLCPGVQHSKGKQGPDAVKKPSQLSLHGLTPFCCRRAKSTINSILSTERSTNIVRYTGLSTSYKQRRQTRANLRWLFIIWLFVYNPVSLCTPNKNSGKTHSFI